VDFDLERGLTLRGKLTDKVTGRPVQGSVSWHQLPDNPNLKDYSTARWHGVHAKPDGSFEVAAVPGPGLLMAVAWNDRNRYRRAAAAEAEALVRDAFRVGGPPPTTAHVIVRVDPSEKKPASLIYDVALEPGVSRKGTVLGPDGKPLTGALAGG